jgi:hypothetical protein
MTDNGQKIIDLDRKRMNAMAQKDLSATKICGTP